MRKIETLVRKVVKVLASGFGEASEAFLVMGIATIFSVEGAIFLALLPILGPGILALAFHDGAKKAW